mgnify:CR=1 FL=1
MKHKSIFFSISLVFSSFCLSAQELPKEVVWQEVEGVNVPVPPQTHPRLYVRSSDLPALKERMKTPQAQQTLSLMKELSKDRTPAEEAAVTNRGFRYYYEMRGVTSRVQLQALDPPCHYSHARYVATRFFRHSLRLVAGQRSYADNGCHGI